MYYSLSCGGAKRKCIEQFQRGHLLFRKLFEETSILVKTLSSGRYPQEQQTIQKGRLSFHPIPCGTTLISHVTSGATYVWRVTGLLSLLENVMLHKSYTEALECILHMTESVNTS